MEFDDSRVITVHPKVEELKVTSGGPAQPAAILVEIWISLVDTLCQ